MAFDAVQWLPGRLRILDQTQLPEKAVYQELEKWPQVVEAIQSMKVRGAPAIGLTGAYGLVLAAQEGATHSPLEFWRCLDQAAEEISGARPTAVNLAWAVQRTREAAKGIEEPGKAVECLLAEAQAIECENLAANRRIGEHGAALIPPGATLLTHCNTGALATGGYGTALGIVRAAWDQGKVERVIATETRPLLQGARLTAWELQQEGIPVTLVVDSAAGHLLRQGQVSAVLVGADRIAANGDVANKIGTYSLAILARAHGVPLYVAAPASTVDLGSAKGEEIPVEERSGEEVTTFRGMVTAPAGIEVYNPAFDITPAELVSAIVTETGVIRPPYETGLQEAKGHRG